MRGWAELAVMGLVLLVLAVVLFAAMWSVGQSSREEAALSRISEICAALRSADDDALASLAENPPHDPWGGAFSIRVGDDEILVRSAGPDGEFGSGDDVAAVLDRRTGRRTFLEGCVGR